MDQRIGWCVVALVFAVIGCSGPSDGNASGARPVASSKAAPSSASTTPAPATAAAQVRGLRARYESCIDRAAAVVPATQACIEDEGEFQRSRLDAVVARLRRDHPERAAALEYEQAAWRADLENRCGWHAETEGQQQRIEANICTLEETAKRADVLDR